MAQAGPGNGEQQGTRARRNAGLSAPCCPGSSAGAAPPQDQGQGASRVGRNSAPAPRCPPGPPCSPPLPTPPPPAPACPPGRTWCSSSLRVVVRLTVKSWMSPAGNREGWAEGKRVGGVGVEGRFPRKRLNREQSPDQPALRALPATRFAPTARGHARALRCAMLRRAALLCAALRRAPFCGPPVRRLLAKKGWRVWSEVLTLYLRAGQGGGSRAGTAGRTVWRDVTS